ncbi:uncharacterized protein Non2 [Ochlerotatus camptorhynchus]|uniref:uncharacterized protein Non2 n=1 Tax=Ochlerotatus camptorhynchus TaxID=644619 RepID=UPI0031CF10AB
MSEPTKDDLRKEIAVILKDANLEETAAKKVRLQLEANLKCDLSARKKEVDDLVMEYVNAQDESGEEDEEDDDEEEEEEKSPKKNSKKPAAKKKADSEDEDEEDEEEEENSEDDKKKKGKRGAPAKRSVPPKKKKRGSDSEEESEGSEEVSDDDYKPTKGPKGAAKKAGPGRKKKGGSDSDSDEDWKRSKPKAKKAAPGAKKGGGKGTGFTRPYNLSPELAAICGAEALPRHEVVKKVWTIIKERNLYDPKNKQYAICDSELQKVIGVKRFRTFGMLKYLKPHFLD